MYKTPHSPTLRANLWAWGKRLWGETIIFTWLHFFSDLLGFQINIHFNFYFNLIFNSSLASNQIFISRKKNHFVQLIKCLPTNCSYFPSLKFLIPFSFPFEWDKQAAMAQCRDDPVPSISPPPCKLILIDATASYHMHNNRNPRSKFTKIYVIYLYRHLHFCQVFFFICIWGETLWVAVQECLPDSIIENFIKQTHQLSNLQFGESHSSCKIDIYQIKFTIKLYSLIPTMYFESNQCEYQKHHKSIKLPWPHNMKCSFWSWSFCISVFLLFCFLSFFTFVFLYFCLFLFLSRQWHCCDQMSQGFQVPKSLLLSKFWLWVSESVNKQE